MNQQELTFCKNILKKVSRSFALTIPMLDDIIYEPIMITYLQDRLLDNFEDEIKDIELSRRKNLMDKVVEIFNPEKNFTQIEEPLNIIKKNACLLEDDSLKKLTENADLLRNAYDSLEDEVKKISYKWLQEMNKGMKKYLSADIKTFSDLDEYCYYVAGTVGGFLTETIIYKLGINKKDEKQLLENFKDAGLFLQKINLVRDVKIDIRERGKCFWPLESLGIIEREMLSKKYKNKALASLERMIESIESHISGLKEYYYAIPDQLTGYKKFYCVNNALGLATIEKMRNNPKIFYGKGKVKVPKFEFLKIIKSPESYFESIV